MTRQRVRSCELCRREMTNGTQRRRLRGEGQEWDGKLGCEDCYKNLEEKWWIERTVAALGPPPPEVIARIAAILREHYAEQAEAK